MGRPAPSTTGRPVKIEESSSRAASSSGLSAVTLCTSRVITSPTRS